ncbi:UNVERIFIED_ORG: hypothetical protein ABIB19_003219 [Arthrobacter sp. UYEF10]
MTEATGAHVKASPNVPGRPSLGSRDSFAVKLSPARGDKIRSLKKLQGRSYQDILEPIINRALDEIDIESLKGQEALPLDKAS